MIQDRNPRCQALRTDRRLNRGLGKRQREGNAPAPPGKPLGPRPPHQVPRAFPFPPPTTPQEPLLALPEPQAPLTQPGGQAALLGWWVGWPDPRLIEGGVPLPPAPGPSLGLCSATVVLRPAGPGHGLQGIDLSPQGLRSSSYEIFCRVSSSNVSWKLNTRHLV